MDDISQIKGRYGEPSEETSEELKARLSEAAHQAKVRTQEVWEETTDLIREYPVASIGIALVAGAVIGGLIAGGASSENSAGVIAEEASDQSSESLENVKEAMAKSLISLRSLIDDALTKLK